MVRGTTPPNTRFSGLAISSISIRGCVGRLSPTVRLTFNMDTLCLPIRYEGLTETDLQVHLRHSANKLRHGERMEVFLSQAGVVIPMVKHLNRRRVATLEVLLRSGSISRDNLEKLHELLLAKSYNLSISNTRKRKLIQRVIVLLPIDRTIVVTGTNVLKIVNDILGYEWPTTIAIGYAVGAQSRGLPGRFSLREPFGNVGYQVGYSVGNFLKKIVR